MSTVRHDWTLDEISDLFDRPFHDLLHDAHTTHRQNFDANLIEGAMLLSIKTGACPEDCAYCPQAARYNTELKPEPLLPVDQILDAAVLAKRAGLPDSAWARRGVHPTIARWHRSPRQSLPCTNWGWKPVQRWGC